MTTRPAFKDFFEEQAWARRQAVALLEEMAKAVATGEVHSFKVSWEGALTSPTFEMCAARLIDFGFKDDVVRLDKELPDP